MIRRTYPQGKKTFFARKEYKEKELLRIKKGKPTPLDKNKVSKGVLLEHEALELLLNRGLTQEGLDQIMKLHTFGRRKRCFLSISDKYLLFAWDGSKERTGINLKERIEKDGVYPQGTLFVEVDDETDES